MKRNYFQFSLIKLSMVVLMMFVSTAFASAAFRVKGNVKDSKGEVVTGATIAEKGYSASTISDVNGNFEINASGPSATLTISFLGYQTKQENINNRSVIAVVLADNAQAIDEVVVTAYATQKKVNVTGAISAVKGRDLVSIPVANITNALIGNTPGVSGLQTSGEPGRNAANIYIRGISTYGSSTPLVVIDGIEQASERAFDEINSMDANEIDGISILKDAASTAVYGIRGANGVVIVTTKRGSAGKPTISFSTNFGLTKATKLQKGLSAYDYAMFRNEGINNEMNSFSGTAGLAGYLFDDNDLWKFKNNRDFTDTEVDAMTNLSAAQKTALKNSPALYYGSKNLYADQFNKTAPQSQSNINISGGTDKVKYFVSLGYFTQKGITNATEYYGSNTGSSFDRYNFRSNFDIDVMKNLQVSINMAGQFGTTKGPGTSADPYDLGSRYKVIMQYIYDGNPFLCPGIIDGKLINNYAGVAGSIQNPLAVKTGSSIGSQNAVYNLLISGTGYIYNSLLDNSVKVNHQMDYLLKGLRSHATVSYQDNYNRYVTVVPSLPSYTVQRSAADPNVLEFFGGSMGAGTFNSYGYSNWNKLYIDAGLDWSGVFGEHNISGLLLGKGSKYTMPSDNNHTPSGMMGLVGRATYNYGNRYMAELNVGYNGTEQFASGNRFGMFPAYSVGWVPTMEPFFPENDILTFMKIRASYGSVGNDLLASGSRRYLYLPNTYNLEQSGYYLGNSDGSSQNTYYTAATEGTLGNKLVTWERANKYDVGLEMKFFRDRLSLVADYFKEDRNNILTTLETIPAIYGVSSGSVPPSNVGKTENKGYEVSLNWTDKVGKLGYFVEGDVSFARNKILYKAESLGQYYWMNETGFSIGQKFGLVSDGLFNTNDELANRPYNEFTSNKATLGDVRYKDLNGDGRINSKDQAPIGYANYPEYHFNLKTGINYKGFDLKLLFIGTANGSYYLNSGYTIPFFKKAGNAWNWMYEGRWTAEKYAAGEKINYPRATFDATSSDNNFLTSDYWLRSSNFFKLKNIEVGYSFPQSGFLKKVNIESLRIYANMNNVYTFKNALSEIGIDPETTDGSSYIYPLTSIVNTGFSLKF